MEERTKPLLLEYDSQLQKQQNLVSTFKYVSPAILMQQSLNNIAGTSEKHYNDYKKQVFEFSDEWRNYLVPMLFKGKKFTVKDYEGMPKFIYKNRIEDNVWFNILTIFTIGGLIFLAFVRKNLKTPHAGVGL